MKWKRNPITDSMAKKENKGGIYLKNRLEDIVDLTGNIGLVSAIDFVVGFSIDYPLRDIAVGAGFQAGDAMSSGKTSRFVSSVISLGLLMSPDCVHLASSGDAGSFLKSAGAKVSYYIFGTMIGGILNEFIRETYDRVVEVNALFRDEKEAREAFEYVKGIVKIGGYVRRSVSSVDDLQQTKEGYLLHAKIVDKTSKIQRYVKPSLEEYFSETRGLLEAKASDVVKERGNTSSSLLELLKGY